ncbi:MAG TPA: YkgJ family cysteine cluster protein [Polyangia bacterium]|nr:YkgJ family cysteine cluster protein [Polyangia bacterium]
MEQEQEQKQEQQQEQERRELDAIWLDAAARLGIPVVRDGDAYVHFDGHRLHIAPPVDLDADDTLGQLILHELCHALVEGPAARHLPDWGLDNTTDRDRGRELSAVRLQAHLTAAYGLRDLLFPTTEVRAFYFALPADALGPDPCARQAAARAAAEPWRGPLHDALARTAHLRALPLHASGFPLSGDAERTCGSCVWRTAGGQCRQAAPRRLQVAASERACTRWEGALDCRACAACCRHAYDSVTISRRDLVRLRHPGLVVDRGRYRELARAGDRCAALAGDDGGPYACTIYDDRPRPCREFEVAGRHCLTARRRVGLCF